MTEETSHKLLTLNRLISDTEEIGVCVISEEKTQRNNMFSRSSQFDRSLGLYVQIVYDQQQFNVKLNKQQLPNQRNAVL